MPVSHQQRTHMLTFFPHWMRHREWNYSCFVCMVFVIILHENYRQSEESHIVANTVLMGKGSLNFYTTAWMEVLNDRASQTHVQRLSTPQSPDPGNKARSWGIWTQTFLDLPWSDEQGCLRVVFIFLAPRLTSWPSFYTDGPIAVKILTDHCQLLFSQVVQDLQSSPWSRVQEGGLDWLMG